MTEDFHRIDAADARQVYIHEDHFGLVIAGQLDAEAPVPRAQQAHIRAAGDELFHQLQIGRIVFHIKQGSEQRTERNLRVRNRHRFHVINLRRCG